MNDQMLNYPIQLSWSVGKKSNERGDCKFKLHIKIHLSGKEIDKLFLRKYIWKFVKDRIYLQTKSYIPLRI